MSVARLLLVGLLGCSRGATSPAGTNDDSMGTVSRVGCEGSWQCTDYGQCSNVNNMCIATSDEDCYSSLECTLNGLCHAVGGCCVAADDHARCQSSYIFGVNGICPFNDPYCQGYPAGMGAKATVAHPTYEADMMPVLDRWCGACHGGDDRDNCAAGTCLADHYEDNFMPSEACTGLSMIDCAIYRLEESYRTQGKLKLLSEFGGVILMPRPLLENMKLWAEEGFSKK